MESRLGRLTKISPVFRSILKRNKKAVSKDKTTFRDYMSGLNQAACATRMFKMICLAPPPKVIKKNLRQRQHTICENQFPAPLANSAE